MQLLYVCVVLFIIGFIVWQLKMLKKYVLTFDKFQINVKEGWLSVNKQVICFADIAYVSVREKTQPTAVEKALSKSAFYAYMAEAVFHLHDGMSVTCLFNTKGALYAALKKLAPYVQINADWHTYKPRWPWGFLLLMAAAVLAGLLLKSC